MEVISNTKKIDFFFFLNGTVCALIRIGHLQPPAFTWVPFPLFPDMLQSKRGTES